MIKLCVVGFLWAALMGVLAANLPTLAATGIFVLVGLLGGMALGYAAKRWL